LGYGLSRGLDIALSSLGYGLLKQGKFQDARVQLERAIVASTGQHFIDHTTHSGMLVMAYLSWAQWILGFPNQAAQTMDNALQLVRKEGSPASLAFGLIYAAQLYRLARESAKTMALSSEAIEIARRSGMALLEAQAKFEHGWSVTQGIHIVAGLAEISDASKELRATGAIASAWRAGPLAECWARNGNPERGLQVLLDAFQQIETTGEHFYEAELWRLFGELTFAAASSKADEAERAFNTARELASRQNAKSFELRAATTLGRFLEQRGRRAEATATVTSIYDLFSEGLETPDLKEA